MHGTLGQDHGLATAHFPVESGCDPPESQQIIVLSQCSRFSPFPKDTEDSQSWGFWVGSGFMKEQQLLQEQEDPRSWEKQVTSKATLMACLKPMSLQGSLCLLCYKWILTPLSLWALVTDFKGGQDVCFRFWKADTQLPFLQSTHKVRRNTSIRFAFFFFPLSAAFIEYLTAWSHCCVNSKAHFQLTPWLVFSADRPPFLNRGCVCWQTAGNRTLNDRIMVLQEQTASGTV